MRCSRALLYKHLSQGLWVWLPSALCLFFAAWVFVYVQGQIDTATAQAILARLPEAVKRLAPVPLEDLISFPARIATFFEHPLVHLLLAFWCIGRGTDVVAGELGRGTLELLLAQPVTRAEILLSSTYVTLCGMALFALVIWLGLSVGIMTCYVKRTTYRWIPSIVSGPLVPKSARTADPQVTYIPMRQFAQTQQYLSPALNYLCLGVFVSGLSTCISAAYRFRWQAIGCMTGIWVAAALAENLGQYIAWLKWLRGLSFLRAYEPIAFVVAPMRDPSAAWSWWQPRWDPPGWEVGPLTCNLILLFLGLVAYVAALRIFERRDIPAPI